MNSTSIKIKKFFSNRNTVAIICAFIGIVVLYLGYTMKVQSAIKPVTVPFAKTTIQPRTKIKEEMIDYVNIASAAVDEMKDIIICDSTKKCQGVLIGKYTAVNTMIPKGSLFYEASVVKESQLPDAAVYATEEGETLVNLTVNMSTTYVNSIVPGGYIDIYIRTVDQTTGTVRAGKFIENIEILAVKTSSGLNVFENSEEQRVPAYILFAVPEEQFLYLIMAAKLGLEIYPVPINVDLENSPETSNFTSTELQEYIDALAEKFSQNVVVEDEDGNTTIDPNNTTDPIVNNGTNGDE